MLEKWRENYWEMEDKIVADLVKIIESYKRFMLAPRFEGQGPVLGPRGPRYDQYHVLADLLYVLERHIKLHPDRDRVMWGDRQGLKVIYYLLRLAFVKSYYSNYSRQKLHRWVCVLRYAWLERIQVNNFELAILQRGGIEQITKNWKGYIDRRSYYFSGGKGPFFPPPLEAPQVEDNPKPSLDPT